jgi:hypothetical protein
MVPKVWTQKIGRYRRPFAAKFSQPEVSSSVHNGTARVLSRRLTVCQAGLGISCSQAGPSFGLTPSKRNAISHCETHFPRFGEMRPNVPDEFGGISEEADTFSKMSANPSYSRAKSK